MNILFISNLYPAYPDHSVREISYALHNFVKIWKKSHNIIVFRPDFIPSRVTYNIEDCIELDGVKIFNIPIFRIPKTQVYFSNEAYKIIKKIGFVPQKVIAHMSSSFLWSWKLSMKYKADFIVGIHNSDLIRINFSKYDKIFQNSYKIACRSDGVKKHFMDIFSKYKNKVFVANSGIDVSEIENTDFFIEKIDSWKNKKQINFLTVAVLQKLKNIDINLRVFSELKKYNWEYTIIGDGEEKENLMVLSDKLGIKEKVKFVGMKTRKEVMNYMKNSDVFLMVSAPETFGLAYLEAMAKANIIIGAKNWGIDGVILNNQNGFLCNPRDEEDIKSVIIKLFNSDVSFKKDILIKMEDTIRLFTDEKVAESYIKNII